MGPGRDRRDWAILLALFVLVTLVAVLPGSCNVQANPVERLVVRARVFDDGRQARIRLGGVIDSVRYFPAGGMSARRDSAQLWITTEAFAYFPEGVDWETVATVPFAERVLDAGGEGSLEWSGRIEAFGFYTAPWPADGMQTGQRQPVVFRDECAFVRATYVDSVLVTVTAWGAESLPLPMADSSGAWADVGQDMTVAADSSRYYFTGGLREGGGRYLVRTLAAWTSGSNRWLRLEVVRDSAAIDALIP